ncbi:MAG: ATP-binding cassette domain-containing protein, partial [Oscillospiraceae bacterium]|nr:ATP-binding cassette domain-containing protein [Oscillospiraceae bacterium]
LFAYVPQDYAMLSGTVLENLQLVAPDVTEEEYKRVLKLADADFVWDTAAGVQTHLGENNTGLSKGQLQRLAITRAVLMDRKIFLLDECTSALDAQTEDTVLHNLKKLNKSAILVTHRPQAVEELENVTFVPMDQ